LLNLGRLPPENLLGEVAEERLGHPFLRNLRRCAKAGEPDESWPTFSLGDEMAN
jgi:hypothetical protein